jgi:type III pantothenate kinase
MGSLPLEIGLAEFTEAAIYNGTLMAVIGLIEHVLAKQPEYRQLILTGGDAELVAGQLDVATIVDPDLVLRGLLCVLEGHA